METKYQGRELMIMRVIDSMSVFSEIEDMEKAEYLFMTFKAEQIGDYFKTLIYLIQKSDLENRYLLLKAYPELVYVVHNFQTVDGYWEKLKQKYHTEFGHLPIV